MATRTRRLQGRVARTAVHDRRSIRRADRRPGRPRRRPVELRHAPQRRFAHAREAGDRLAGPDELHCAVLAARTAFGCCFTHGTRAGKGGCPGANDRTRLLAWRARTALPKVRRQPRHAPHDRNHLCDLRSRSPLEDRQPSGHADRRQVGNASRPRPDSHAQSHFDYELCRDHCDLCFRRAFGSASFAPPAGERIRSYSRGADHHVSGDFRTRRARGRRTRVLDSAGAVERIHRLPTDAGRQAGPRDPYSTDDRAVIP